MSKSNLAKNVYMLHVRRRGAKRVKKEIKEQETKEIGIVVSTIMEFLSLVKDQERVKAYLTDTLSVLYERGKIVGKEEFLEKFPQGFHRQEKELPNYTSDPRRTF